MDRRRLLLALALAALSGPALASGGEKKKGGGESYIQIPTLSATVTRRSGQRGVMTLESGIDVKDASLRTRAEQSMPRLRAAYAEVLSAYAASLAPGGLPNADYLSRELQRRTDTVLGKPGARLLLGAILVN